MTTYSPNRAPLTGFAPPRDLTSPMPLTLPPPLSLNDENSGDSEVSSAAISPAPQCAGPISGSISGPIAIPGKTPKTVMGKSPVEKSGAKPQVIVVRGARAIAPYVAAWQDLADAASEPNVFYEPWMLLPALEAFAPAAALEFHLVFAPGRGPDSPQPQLCGLFPLVRGRHYKGLRTRTLSLWKHLYCALCTPLVRRGVEAEALGALLDFLAAAPRGVSLLELPYVSGDGPFGRALVEVFGERGTPIFLDESWTRAFLRPQCAPDGETPSGNSPSGEDYLKNALSGRRRKEFRRKEHRLADEGAVRYAELECEPDPDAALETFIEDFLRIEASGWKGESGSAFACQPAHREYFRTIVTQAHRRGRLAMTQLRVGDRAIASKCDFRAGTGAFAFKIGFDEAFARFSPSVLLEIERVRQIHERKTLAWMDSCAVRNHPMINRLWLERRTLQTLVVATGRGRGELIVAVLPLMRYLKTLVKRAARHPLHPENRAATRADVAAELESSER